MDGVDDGVGTSRRRKGSTARMTHKHEGYVEYANYSWRFLLALWLCGLLLLLGSVACGDDPTVSPAERIGTNLPDVSAAPTEQASTALARRPAAGPTEGPASETPDPPGTDIPIGIPFDPLTASLAMLPEGQSLIYINMETAAIRPAFQEDLEFQLSHFISMDELPFAEGWLRSVGTRSLALSHPYDRTGWACVLEGDYTKVHRALEQAAASGMGFSVNLAETHRQVDRFALIRLRASGRESQIYLAVPDPETLAVSPDLQTVQEMIDRRKDGRNLAEPLSAILKDWGTPDHLQAFAQEVSEPSAQSNPMYAIQGVVLHATLEGDSETKLRFLYQFPDEAQAMSGHAWLEQQTDPSWLNVGFGAQVQIDQWGQRGRTVYGEATVSDEEVLDLIVAN